MLRLETLGSARPVDTAPVATQEQEARAPRPRVAGKFFYRGDEKFWVRGVTYGTFRPDERGQEFTDPAQVERDFAAMAANGLTAVRTYTVPPRWLLDTAHRHGLRVMVGLPWEQHIAFLDDPSRAASIEARVRAGARTVAGHPALLCLVIGNEIPSGIVRWHGARRVERFLRRLYEAVKAEDPGALVTYVNYPSTEFLRLPFLDFVCFNVYLESQPQLEAYLARLQNLAGERPLVMGEIGLDSRRHGDAAQARVLDWQVRTSFAAGCAGVFVFAWTDRWHRGGHDIEDWDFGLVRRDGHPKPALATVREAMAAVPFPRHGRWPRISVVVCTYNGARTIRDTFDGLLRLEYPNYEVIVVNDGSTDATPAIARQYGFRLVTTKNHGLSHARNVGLEAATGEIVAYLDDDAWPDPHWLTYLAATFLRTSHVGVGGPNLAPPGDGPIADCVANAPGGPLHVLLSDRVAEHIPGCNMAFRTAALQAIGGFDPIFRTAGDDVDVCWRLQERGGTLGFHAAAMVWHHRRNSVRAYWRQQIGYGRAEAMLERKWPEKYNDVGHLTWGGRLYGRGLARALGGGARIFHGQWGGALFQSLYERAPRSLWSLPLMPEWYLVVTALAALAALGAAWPRLQLVLPLLLLSLVAPVAQAVLGAMHATFTSAAPSRRARLARLALTAALHLVQPLARLRGRLRHGLTPWRRRGEAGAPPVTTGRSFIWSERWRAPADWIRELETALRARGTRVRRGGEWDRWDLEVRDGLLGGARTRLAIEEHGGGRQLVRVHIWPRLWWPGVVALVALGALTIGARLDAAPVAVGVLGAASVALAARLVADVVRAMEAARHAVATTGAAGVRSESDAAVLEAPV